MKIRYQKREMVMRKKREKLLKERVLSENRIGGCLTKEKQKKKEKRQRKNGKKKKRKKNREKKERQEA